MCQLNTIFEFSRTQCVAICSFLVPANLIFTIATLVLLYLGRPKNQIQFTTALGSLATSALFLHITTWLVIGVIHPFTFILFILGSTCLIINSWVIIHPKSEEQLQQIIDLIIKTTLKFKTASKNVFTN